MTRRILSSCVVFLTLLASLSERAYAQQGANSPLAQLQFDIVGVRLQVDPPALTVPKNIATQINTSLVLPPGIGAEARDAILTLTDGAVVEAELRGPSIPATRIVVSPGQPIPIPALALPGDYFLDGIRLAKNGQTILDATSTSGAPATTIPIKVINEVFVTSVTSRPLSLEEIQSKGIVIDQANFQAVNFQVAFNIDGAKFTIDLPAALPTPELLSTSPNRAKLIETLSVINRTLAATQTVLPPEFDRPGLNFSIAALPFMPVPEDDGGVPALNIPPVTGLVVIPGNVAFLNQFFSVLLMVTNVAPDGSLLDLHDVTGTIVLPTGKDRVAGTFDQPGDDPLRLARLESNGGQAQPTIQVVQLGPDGKLGTADDIAVISPLTSGQGEFSVEGLQEGGHTFDISINAVLHGLPSGPVRLTGQAAGAVFVRNPTFSITLAHPRTIRAGEPYTLYATVMNTSRSTANLVSINLDPRGISGAQLVSSETVRFDTIPSGQSATAQFSLIAQQTGEVTATSFTGDAATGGAIQLVTGVGERGVVLSPNTIVLPQTADFLPPSLVAAAQRVLGQAFSIATAPAQALPEGVLFVKRQTVIDRGVDLAEAGERVKFGEPLGRVVEDLLLDWIGNTSLDEGFDQLMRTTSAGAAFISEIAKLVAPEALAGVLDHQRAFAQTTVGRTPYVSAVAGGPPGAPAPLLHVDRADGSAVGDAAEGRELTMAGAALLDLTGASNGGRYAVLGLAEPQLHTFELTAPAAGAYDLGIVIPGAQPGTLRQLRYPGITLDAGGVARVAIDLGTPGSLALRVDRNGDGVAEQTVQPQIEDIVEGAPQLLDAHQLESTFRTGAGDPADPATYGLLVAALFDKPVTKASAELKSNFAVDANAVVGAALQPSGRVVYLYLQKPIGGLTPRTLTVSNIADARDNVLGTAAKTITTVLSGGGHVFGQVRSAQGVGVPDAVLRLSVVDEFNNAFDVSTIRVDRNGSFDFDFVPRLGSHFTLTAQHPITRDVTSLSARIRASGEQLLLNPTFLGRGTVRGRLLATDGVTALAGIPVGLIPGAVLGSRGFTQTTNALGEFVFTDVPVGIFTLTASDGQRGFAQAPGLLASASQIVTQDLVLVNQPDVGGRLVGRVFLSDGTTPAVNFVVYAGTYKRDTGAIAAVAQTTTDATGSFAFGQPFPVGSYDVVAFDPATQQIGATKTSIAATLTSSVSITLEATGAVEGVVFNAQGHPAGGALIAGGVALATADANGFFRIEGVPAGARVIEAGDPVTRRRGSTPVTVLPGQTVRVAITLEARATIVGRVLDANGNPMPRASVRIPQVGGYQFVIANNQGVFTFPDLPLGDYLLQAPGPSAESLISFMEANGIDPASAFTTGDGPVAAPPPTSGDTNAVLAAYQKAVQGFLSVDESILGLPIAQVGGFGWNKVNLFQDSTTAVADIKFLSQGSVTGKTVDGLDHPTGAVVRVTGLGVSLTGAPTVLELGRMNSDAATGAFSFGGIPRFDLATFQTAGVRGGDFGLDAAQQFSPTIVSFRGQLNTATPNLQNIVLKFPLAVDTNGTVSGIVLMPDGLTPAPANTDVAISFGDLTVRTDANGRFQSLLPIPAGGYTLVARALSGLKGQVQAQVPAGGNVDVSIRLLGLGHVTVQVKRPNGAAVPNAIIHALRGSFPNDSAQGVTDANGQVRFVNLTEGPFSVTAEETGTGLMGRSSANIVRDAEVTLPIVITASGTVTGTFVTASDGQPIPFAQIVVNATGAQAYASTDATGRFAVLAIPIGTFTVSASDPATNRAGRGSGELRFEGQSVDVTVVQVPRGVVSGIVLNSDGVAPVAGARVELNSGSAIRLQATARDDGSFRFEGVSAGEFTLKGTDTVSGFEGSAHGTITFEGQQADARITLAPFGTLHVKVLDHAGQPASNVDISIGSRSAAADANGEFEFPFLALGKYRIVARSLADAGDAGVVDATLANANETVAAIVTLRGTGQAAITVLDANALPVPSAKVTLQTQGSFGSDPPGPSAGTQVGFTDAFGVVTFDNVPLGDFFGRGEAAALSGVATGSVTTPDQTGTATVRLGPSGTVSGRVLLPDGHTPATQAIVTLRFQSQSQLQSGVLQITTGLDGRFEFGGIPVGSFTLSAFEVVSHGVRNAAGSIVSNGAVADLGDLILDNAGPRVTSITPADRTTGVAPGAPIVIIFDESIQASSVDVSGAPAANILLFAGPFRQQLNPPVFSNGNRTLTVQPQQPLGSATQYSLTIKGAPDGPLDENGLPLPGSVVSTFNVADVIPPVVVTTSPLSAAHQVTPDATIRVSFSEPVAGATVVLRSAGGAVVPGQSALTLGNTVAVFSPQDFLQANTSYTFTVSSVFDTSGNPLVGGTFTAQFFTVDTLSPLITALQLTGTPRAGATIALQPLITGADTVRVEYVVGGTTTKISLASPFAVSIALPIDQAQLAILATAVDAVGNRSSAFSQLVSIQPNQPPAVTLTRVGGGATVSQGQTLTFQVSATDDDQLAQVLFSAVGAATTSQTTPAPGGQSSFTTTFTLPVPAGAPSGATLTVQAAATDSASNQSNVASLTLNVVDGISPTVTVLTPVNNAVVLPGQSLDVSVDLADDVGLASVTLQCNPTTTGCETRTLAGSPTTSHQTFTVTVPAGLQPPQTLTLTIGATDSSGNLGSAGRILQMPDSQKPSITSLTSSTGSTRFAPGDTAVLRANVLDNVGVTALTFTTEGGVTSSGTVPVVPALTSGLANLSIPIGQQVANGSTITVRVKARDAANNLSDEATLQLTVGDTAAPSLTILEPANNGTSVAPGGSVHVRATATDDIGVSRFTLTVTGVVTTSETRNIAPAATPAEATFDVAIPAATAAGTITLSVEAFDTTGTSSGTASRTVAVSDTVAPQVQIVTPVADALLDPRDPINVSVSASDGVGVTSISFSATGTVSASETRPVTPAATTKSEAFTVNVTPLPAAGGTLTLNASARDAANNVGNATAVTVRLRDVVAPDVLSTTPAASATGVDPQAVVVVRFTEPMDPATLSSASLQLLRNGTLVPTTLAISGNDDIVTLTPVTRPLPLNTLFTISVSTAATDKAANPLTAARTFTFTTASPDTTAPRFTTIDPVNNATGVSLVAPIVVAFSEAINPATVTAQSFVVSVGGNPVAGAFSFQNANATARFTPTDPLPTDTLVTVQLSAAITDAFNNALAASDGSPLTTPLAFTFRTAQFSLTSPSADIIENSALLLEARANGALGVASVIFTVNGVDQPAVSGPSFTRTFTVGAAASTPTLTIRASARNSGGTEIAFEQKTFNVVVGLAVTPTFTGAPVGGAIALRYSVSSALASDLPITLSAGDASLVTFPVNPVVIPAGQTFVDASVNGVATGATTILGTSSRGVAATVLAVSPTQSGQTLTPMSATVGLAISNPPAAGSVILQSGATKTVRIAILDAPAAADTPVSIVSTNSAVATAVAGVVAAGTQTVDLDVTALADGVATLIVRIGDEVRGVTIFVGAPPPGSTPLLMAPIVGVSVSVPPNAGQVIAPAGRQLALTVPFLLAPVATVTVVTVTTSNAAVATATTAVIPAGQTTVALNVTTVADGVATLTLRSSTEVRGVTVFVGALPPGSTPLLMAPIVGVSAVSLPTLGRAFTPASASRTLGVRLFDTPVAADTVVTITTSNSAVANVTGSVVIAAGQQIANLNITTGGAGTAILTLEAGGVRRELTIIVGSDPTPDSTPPIVAAPVGVSVVPNPTMGRVFGQLGSTTVTTLGIPLLTAPLGSPTTVTVTSSNAAVVSFGTGATTTGTIFAGEQVLQLPLAISGTQGAALVTFEFNGERREVVVIVGTPSPSEIPAVTAPVVGVKVNP